MIAGIDLGTTNSLIGTMEAGFPVLIAGADGSRLTPSVVHFPEKGEPIAGEEARRMRGVAPTETVFSVKRLMGKRGGDPLDDAPYFVKADPGQPVRLLLRGKEYTPEEISAVILRKLKADAEAALGSPVERAVISVPAYFNDAQRAATKKAGELAGLHVERIISEPTAAALAYGMERLGEKSKIAVYDLGGGTFDLSVLELHGGVFEVLSTHGDTRLGGDDLDAALAALICRKLGLPPEKTTSLIEAAQSAKHRLSESEETEIVLPFFEGDSSLSCTLTRAEADEVWRPIIERTRAHCRRALADAKLKTGDLDAVLLVGGATRMPLVRQFVADFFGRAPDTSQHPDEAVALGAVIQAGILEGSVRQVTLLDVTPLSLGIETFGGLMNVIIPRNTTIPCKAGEMFTNAVAGQTSMRITVLQGEREMARDNWKLGEFEVPFTPAPKGQARVGVQFEIDANGILRVLARDIATGRDHVLELQQATNVADEKVEKMVSESVEHAFEDMNARVFTEAKLKAMEMLPAIDAGLEKAGALLTEEERVEIQSLKTAVQDAIAAGSGYKLKELIEKLDTATERLAALLVEQLLGS